MYCMLQVELGQPMPAEDVTDGGREAIELKQSFRGNHNYFISYLVRQGGSLIQYCTSNKSLRIYFLHDYPVESSIVDSNTFNFDPVLKFSPICVRNPDPRLFTHLHFQFWKNVKNIF